MVQALIIIGIILVAFFVVALMSMLKVASDSDDVMDKMVSSKSQDKL